MSDYKSAAITVMPNGEIYKGAHESPMGYPSAPLLGRYQFSRKAGKSRFVVKAQVLDKRMAALDAKMQDMSYGQRIRALTAADTQANQDNLSHIQLIRLFPEIQGTPEKFYWLDECFVRRDVPALRLREAYRNVTGGVKRLGKLEEADTAFTKYDEIEYRLTKLAENVYTPIEDKMQATLIDPSVVDMSQVQHAFEERRNLDALAALEAMGDNGYDFGDPIAAPDNLANGAFHHTNPSLSDLRAKFVEFRKDNHVVITHVAMNSGLLDKLGLNTWTMPGGPTGIQPVRVVRGGVIPLPGIPGVTAVIDDMIADNKLYAFNKPYALRLGEGPKIMRTFYDEYKHAEAISILDFNQYLSADEQLSDITTAFGGEIEVTENS